MHQENDAIVRRAKIIQPICTGVGSLTLLMTLAIAGMWVVQRLQ
jgi:flagellar biogenesis protein FliO